MRFAGHLQKVFEERDPPADDHRDVPRLHPQILEVRVPGEGHEDVRAQEEDGGENDDGHRFAIAPLRQTVSAKSANRAQSNGSRLCAPLRTW